MGLSREAREALAKMKPAQIGQDMKAAHMQELQRKGLLAGNGGMTIKGSAEAAAIRAER
jgi:hypothetical protein